MSAKKVLVVYRKGLDHVVFSPALGETLDEWRMEDFKDCQLVTVIVYFKKDDGTGRRYSQEYFAADQVSRIAEMDEDLVAPSDRMSSAKVSERFKDLLDELSDECGTAVGDFIGKLKSTAPCLGKADAFDDVFGPIDRAISDLKERI